MKLTLILDPIEYRTTLEQRESRAHGEVAPLRWNGVLDRLAEGRIKPAQGKDMFAPGVHFSWHLHNSTIMAAALKRPLAYLCWGVAYHSGIRRRLARMVLRGADVVFVNEARTRDEVREVADVAAQAMPYFVDAEFFRFVAPAQREDFLFCPGANDRDGDMLLRLAEAGRRVVWLNNVAEIAARFSGRSKNLEIVTRPTFERLRALYGSCRAVVQPLVRDIHAAGQTTALEALVSGAPVILSKGRTADLFSGEQTVSTVDTADTDRWLDAIDRAVEGDRDVPCSAEVRARRIAERHSYPAVSEALLRGLGQSGALRHG